MVEDLAVPPLRVEELEAHAAGGLRGVEGDEGVVCEGVEVGGGVGMGVELVLLSRGGGRGPGRGVVWSERLELELLRRSQGDVEKC
jgi:hypothetical protein